MDILIDSHAHLNFDVFNQDREKIINECLNNNVWVINIGTNYFTSKKAVEIAENYQKGVWA
ncbi:TatD family hydrolase, partial [bacterium]|nr:TatD family hydrolase [bacterium]